MLSAIRSRMQQQHEAQANAANLTATATATPEMQGKQRLESFRLELVNGRAYKLFNACLLTVFIYFMYHK